LLIVVKPFLIKIAHCQIRIFDKGSIKRFDQTRIILFNFVNLRCSKQSFTECPLRALTHVAQKIRSQNASMIARALGAPAVGPHHLVSRAAMAIKDDTDVIGWPGAENVFPFIA
jgi:hypothetical protein